MKENNDVLIRQSIKKINQIKDNKIRPAKNVLFRSVLDEMKQVISRNWGMLRKKIETEVISITKNKTPVPIPQYSQLIDLMEEDLPIQLSEKHQNQLHFIKENIWNINDPDVDYAWLTNKATRAKRYGKTKMEIMERIDIDAIKVLCEGNITIYNQIDKIKEMYNQGEKEYLTKVEKLIQGSRSRGDNKYDQLHLISCFLFMDDYLRDKLIFSTTDKPIINNSKNLSTLPFEIIDLKSLNSYLDRI